MKEIAWHENSEMAPASAALISSKARAREKKSSVI
jgi:hypothetical protein